MSHKIKLVRRVIKLPESFSVALTIRASTVPPLISWPSSDLNTNHCDTSSESSGDLTTGGGDLCVTLAGGVGELPPLCELTPLSDALVAARSGLDDRVAGADKLEQLWRVFVDLGGNRGGTDSNLVIVYVTPDDAVDNMDSSEPLDAECEHLRSK